MIISWRLDPVPFGFVLRLPLQHGQWLPSHSMNTSHVLHRFCPLPYLVEGSAGFSALYLWQIPLQTMAWIQNQEFMNLENCSSNVKWLVLNSRDSIGEIFNMAQSYHKLCKWTVWQVCMIEIRWWGWFNFSFWRMGFFHMPFKSYVLRENHAAMGTWNLFCHTGIQYNNQV